jgi:hypothetical protein
MQRHLEGLRQATEQRLGMRHVRRRHGTEQPHQHEVDQRTDGDGEQQSRDLVHLREEQPHHQRAADRGDEHAEKFEHRWLVSEPQEAVSIANGRIKL